MPRSRRRGRIVGRGSRPDDSGGVGYEHRRFGYVADGWAAVSEPVLAEYEEVLRRPRFGITDERIAEVMGGIRASSLLVQPTVAVTAARDPDDNIFLECAQTAEARYLITGNTADYPDTWAGTRVLTVRLFFELGVDFRPVKGI